MPEQSGSRAEHWARTKRLMIIVMVLWFFFSFVIHWFADSLNGYSFLGFPLGFYMAGQGSLIAFVVINFWFAYAQNKIDEDCGLAEDAE